MKKTLKAGIIGAGMIGKIHAEALNRIGIEIDAICDINIDLARKFKDDYKVNTYTEDYLDILDSDIDVVHICLPANLHYKALIDFIDRGFNIICEKPLVLDNDQALDIKRRIKDKNIHNASSFNIRFHNQISNLKDLISKDKINMVNGSYLQEYHVLPSPYSWRYDENTAGKMRAITEIGSHYFDLVQYLLGKKIVEVSAIFKKINERRKLVDGIMYDISKEDGEEIRINSEDMAIVMMKFEDGLVGSCVLSEVSNGYVNSLKIELTGVNNTYIWDSEDLSNLYIGERNKGIRRLTDPFNKGFSNSYDRFFSDFYSDVLNDNYENIKYPTFDDGILNVLITNAIYESAMNNSKWVKIGDIDV